MSWRTIQRQNFTDWKKLFAFLELEEKIASKIIEKARFPLNLPMRLAEKIRKGIWDDPILKQFLPLVEENQEVAGFIGDPVADQSFRKQKKLLHKYQGRALILCTSACAMNCRFCFRKEFSYDTEDKSFVEEVKEIERDSSLSEIILSGGDPLSLSDADLKNLMHRITDIPHIRRLRFHTRFPIGIPERLDANFLKILAGISKQIVFVIHSNHPLELDEEVLKALRNVLKLGIPVISHTVLLKGINDRTEILQQLFERMIDHGIMPYYLNQHDRVKGTYHFEVPESEGVSILEELARRLPGYALPRYVKEIPHLPYKTKIL